MSENEADDVRFAVDMGDGRTAQCWRALSQPYENCEFSAGLVTGIDPDTIYLQCGRDGDAEPLRLFLRPDEAQAIVWVLTGALWSHEIFLLEAQDERERDDDNQR